MDALTYMLIFLTIFFAAIYWIAWKQELRDRGRAKKKSVKP
jgi:cbb3-type cytochrome oxidase subunit 3